MSQPIARHSRGHETFPLRYGWLKKAFDQVAKTEYNPDDKNDCWGEDAIARFGVGKNMVTSIRHWATSCGIIQDCKKGHSDITTTLGKKLFGNNGIKGYDPYMEHPATLWLIHWQLAAQKWKTTWFWAFSYYPAVTFTRNHFVQKIERFAKERNWKSISDTTLKNDVACFIRTYVSRRPKGKKVRDDALESPLTELGIIKPLDEIDGFRFVRGPKPSLGNGSSFTPYSISGLAPQNQPIAYPSRLSPMNPVDRGASSLWKKMMS